MAMSDATRQRDRSYVSPAVIDDLKRRFAPPKIAQDGPIDPTTLSQQELLDRGLPPKPDAESQPLLRQLWDKAFGRQVTSVSYKFELAVLQWIPYRMVDRKGDQMPAEETRYGSSSNWSGAYLTANYGRQFVQVWGLWQIPPTLQLPPSVYQGDPNLPYVCANWIGLDGQRRYVNSSLPQIGTAVTLVVNAPPAALAWTQWWQRDDPNSVPLPIPLTVQPGDIVLCVLTAVGPQTVEYVMVDLTTGQFLPVIGTAPTDLLPVPSISGATAEWVMERPRIIHSKKQCNFPNYGRSQFSLCVAVEADSINLASLLGGLPQVLQGERLIRMFEVLPVPMRTANVSVPTKLADTSFRVDFVR
jgi:hypothetical protein